MISLFPLVILIPFLAIFIFAVVFIIMTSHKIRKTLLSKRIKSLFNMAIDSKEEAQKLYKEMGYDLKDTLNKTESSFEDGFVNKTKNCKKCGRRIDNDSRFCKYCGGRQ